MTGSIGNLNPDGTLAFLTDGVNSNGGAPQEISFFDLDLTALTSAQRAGILDGSYRVSILTNEATFGGTNDITFDGTGISTATANALESGTAEPGLHTALTSAANRLGTTPAGAFAEQSNVDITAQVKAALNAGLGDYIVAASSTRNDSMVTVAFDVSQNAPGAIQAAAPPAGDLTNTGGIASLNDGVKFVSNTAELSFFEFDLTHLPSATVAAIEAGTQTVDVAVDLVSFGGTQTDGIGVEGVSATTLADIAAGTPPAALFSDLTGTADQVGSGSAGNIALSYVFDATAKVAAALRAGDAGVIVGVYGTGGTPLSFATVNLTGVPQDMACFCTGTRIATARGDIAVEALRPGDVLRTHGGPDRKLRWLGHSRVTWQRHDPLHALPVRIRAGALGGGLPRRDLLVSPGHAIFLGGLLVHAGALVNGTTILREAQMLDVFDYWHIECDTHALILAEGMPAETFLDGAEAIAFDNWADRIAPADVQEMPYPRCKSPRQLPRAWRHAQAA